jgi:hypothetical protein
MKINADIEYKPEPQELAEEFCEMGEHDQAIFFNKIGQIFSNEKFSLSMQLQYITDCETLNFDGRHVMRMIGDYAFKEL